MSISRRKFLTGAAVAGGAALVPSQAFSAPYQVHIQHGAASATEADADGKHSGARDVSIVIPATLPMSSGAPLGGIGTGFVEVRADGCFYEWQIFNSGPWGHNVPSTTAPPPPGPQYLQFLLRTRKASGETPALRRLYLRSDDNDLYTMPFAHDVESIDYHAWFPMTELRYHDATLPVRVSALAFSPIIPGNARVSATPGFHMVFSLENTSDEPVEVSLAALMDNPLASALTNRRLSNRVLQEYGATRLLFDTSAQSDFPSGLGNLCLSVTGGEHSWIGGTFREYVLPGISSSDECHWKTKRMNDMILSVLQHFPESGRLPDTAGGSDPTIGCPTLAAIDAMSAAEVARKIQELSSDALLARVFADAREANPAGGVEADRDLLREVRRNLIRDRDAPHLTWGTGALASSVRLEKHQKTEVRFTLSWYFPHHLTAQGREMGHMYSNWFTDAADVNRFLSTHYSQHRTATETFARTLADTSCGDPLAFAWSSQLSTLIASTWWTKDGSYAVWEGLGCCGLSTTDVDYDGSFSVVALFPELKLSQMKRTIAHQNSLGQVPHNFTGDLDQVDDGFARVDMNPQFVMMVYRDYLWTADHGYLAAMWPHVVKAMAFSESLDTNGDGLPDRDTGLQTYDAWRMRGTPAYIASLWIGALGAAVRIAEGMDQPADAARWTTLLARASASFDTMLFNGDYYSLWVDGKTRDELCMTDQVSGEWFAHLLGLPTPISAKNLDRALDSIFKSNFNSEFGLHNATAPKGGASFLTLTNVQAGAAWSGIEYAFASMLMDHGHHADGAKIVEAIHRRYLRAGRPWSQVECGDHYTRAMSSWATMLATTGFKPDRPGQALTLLPSVGGNFRAPWVMASGFGTIRRAGRVLSISCAYGTLGFKVLKLRMAAQSARIDGHPLATHSRKAGDSFMLEFRTPVSLRANQALEILE